MSLSVCVIGIDGYANGLEVGAELSSEHEENPIYIVDVKENTLPDSYPGSSEDDVSFSEITLTVVSLRHSYIKKQDEDQDDFEKRITEYYDSYLKVLRI